MHRATDTDAGTQVDRLMADAGLACEGTVSRVAIGHEQHSAFVPALFTMFHHACAVDLAASVYTDELRRAIKASCAIRAGVVTDNCVGGRHKSPWPHDQYTEIKTIWIDTQE